MTQKTPLKVLKDFDDLLHLLTGKRVKQIIPRAVELFGDELVNRLSHEIPVRLPPDSPYVILEVRPDASDLVVKAVYRAKAKVYHPDNKETGDAEVFKKITAAFEAIEKERKGK